jgi:hypothetical protein
VKHLSEIDLQNAPPKQRSSLTPTSYSLRTLLIVMLIAVFGALLIQRYVSGRAHFKILEADLEVVDGYLNGAVSIRFSRFNSEDTLEYADFVLLANNLREMKLKELKEGDEFFVEYKERSFWPIKNQNPLELLMIREFDVRKDEIKYYVQLEQWTEVHLVGMANEQP